MFLSTFRRITLIAPSKRYISSFVPGTSNIGDQKQNKEKNTQTSAKKYATLLALSKTQMVPLEFDDLLHVARLMEEETMRPRSSSGSAKPKKIIHIHSGYYPKRIFHIHQIYKQGITEIHYYGIIPSKFKHF